VGGLPFFANSLIMQLYAFISVFLIRHFSGDGDVGVWSQACRLLGAFMFIPTALGAALLPALSRLAHLAPEEFKRLQARVLVLLFALGMPVAVLVCLLSKPFCRLLYGPDKFVQLPAVLSALAVSIVPLYIVATLYQFLVAQNRGGQWSWFMVGTLAVNVSAGLFLIPFTERTQHSGALGAAWSMGLAEWCSMGCALVLLKTRLVDSESLGRMVKAGVAAAGMGMVLWLTRRWFVAFSAPAGVAGFVLFAWLLQVLTREEQRQLSQMLRQKLGLRPANSGCVLPE
jgi:O-antigen/teichoic acid export membrane protein